MFGPPTSDLINDLCRSVNINEQTIKALGTQLKFERTKVISYYNREKNEFVLDENGHKLSESSVLSPNFFSCDDLFQGCLGTCFFLAIILGFTRNLELLEHVMPLDNALHSNVLKGAYHFRFWKLGDWYDVVVDDNLIVDSNHNPYFTKNIIQKNEFWVSLIEKAFSK